MDAQGTPLSGGGLLRRYRLVAGLTQEELAERSGYSVHYVSKLERDERRPPRAALERLAEALDLGSEERAALSAAADGGRDAQITRGPLAGRDREMGEIRRHLAGLGPPVLLFSGEPGIGKTRLLDEAARIAGQNRWTVVRGGCQRRAQDPYAPLTDALAASVQQLSERDRSATLQQAPGLDFLLPELAATIHTPSPQLALVGSTGDGLRPDRERRLLFTSVARYLRAAAGDAGTLLVLDDLQWAGMDALDLLTSLVTEAGSPPVRVIGAYRDSESPVGSAQAGFVADLARDSLVRVLSLDPLSSAQSEQLLMQLIPSDDTARRALMPAIIRRSGGVPFFLVSFIDEVSAQNDEEVRLELPWTVTQVIRQRKNALPETTQELLGVAAVAGRTVTVSLLSRITGGVDEDMLEGLEVATEARLLSERGDGTYSFAHDLIRETIERDLSVGRRQLLHRRIGEALERDGGSSVEPLAFHFGLSDDDDKAIRYLELAGDEAERRVAHAAAADFFRRAIDRIEQSGVGMDATPIREKLGVALYRIGQYDESIAHLEHSLDGHRQAGDEENVHRVAGQLADAHFRRGTSEEILDHVTTLVENSALDGSSGASRGTLALREGLVRLLYSQGSYKRMTTLGRSIGRVGRATRNKRLQTMGTRVEGASLIFLGRLRDGAQLLEESMTEKSSVERDPRIVDVGTALSIAYLGMGELERSTQVSTRMLRFAEELNDPVMVATQTLLIGAALHISGDWERGDRCLRRGQELYASDVPSAVSVRMVPVLGQCLIWGERWEEARRYLETSLLLARSMSVLHAERAAHAHLAELDFLEGRPQAAVARLEPLITEDLAWGYASSLLSTLAAAYLELDASDRAYAAAQRAVAEARHTETWLQGVGSLRVLGMVEASRGNVDGATCAFDEGLQRARRMPFPQAEAQLLLTSGLFEQQRGNEPEAGQKLEGALAIFRRLGAERHIERFGATVRTR